jgi:hypothetical protein
VEYPFFLLEILDLLIKSTLSKCPHLSILKVERVDLMGVGHQYLQWHPNVAWEIHGIKDVQSNGST